MLKAARLGIVDFSTLDLTRHKDVSYLSAILDELEEEQVAKVLQIKQFQTLFLTVNCKPENSKKLWSVYEDEFDTLYKVLMPWVDHKDKETRHMDDITEAIDVWESYFGKREDPETQRRIDMTVAALEAEMVE